MTIQAKIEAAQTASQSGDYQKSIDILMPLLKANPNDINILHQLSLAFIRQELWNDAKDLLEKAVLISPDSAIFYNHLGSVHRNLKNYDKAENCFLHALSLSPDYAEVYNNYGLLFYARHDFEKAEKQFTLALKYKTDYIDALYNLALALQAQEKKAEAAASIAVILNLFPDHLKAHFLMGKILLSEKSAHEAKEHFAHIENLFPNDINILRNITQCYLAHDCFSEAKPYAEKMLSLEPNNAELLYNLGVIAARSDQPNEAISYYQQALKIQPKNFAVLNNLAVLFLEKQNNDVAKYYFEAALKLQPDNEAIQHTLNALSGNKTIKNAPSDYMKNLFDHYADHFETHLKDGLSYCVPTSLKEIIEKYSNFTLKNLTILDLGCGTGLSGELFKPWAEHLIGVDLSAKMIEKANQKSCYDELIVAENLDYLQSQKEKFDLILAADVFVYQGDLSFIFKAAFETLKPNGIFAFTAEIAENDTWTLLPTGRFAHSKAYLKQLADTSGFNVLTIETAPTRQQYEETLEGYYVLLQHP